MGPSLIMAAFVQQRYEELGRTPRRRRDAGSARGVALTLFTCLFAAQSAAIVLGPVLPQVAHDLDVSTAAAGQLRTLLGLAAGVSALALLGLGRRVSLRARLLAGSAAIAAGSAASALAPTFGLLAAAQLLTGAGVGITIAAGTAAAAEWAPPAQRARVLSWTLLGPPAAWIVGMPLMGALGGESWRFGIVFPLVSATAAVAAVRARARSVASSTPSSGLRDALADPAVAAWGAGELLANAGWAGVLVYTGALCAEVHGTSPAATGAILAVGAAAFVAGNVAFRRFVLRDVRTKLLAVSPALAVAVLVLGTVRPTLTVTTAAFSVAAFIAGGRVLLGNAAGLAFAPERRVAAMSIRTAATQLGYFVGTAITGAVLGAFGWGAFGIAAAALIAAAPLPLLAVDRRSAPIAVPTTA